MAADSANKLIELFSERFSSADIKWLLELCEDDAVFPTHHGTAKGIVQIRAAIQG